MTERRSKRFDMAATPAARVIAAAGGAGRLAVMLDTSRTWVWRWQQPVDRGGTGGRIPTPQLRPVWRLIRRHQWPISAEDLLEVGE